MKAAAEAGLAPHVWYTGMLHALPPFPAVDGFIQRFQAANILPKAESEELSARYAQRTAVYPHQDPDMVSSHNDSFKPDNILFDGHRVWLVDWEAAFLNEQFADLAVVANLVVTNEAEEKIYLQEYFGEPPDQYQLARFFLMQQVAQIFYGMVFLLLGSSGKPIDWSETGSRIQGLSSTHLGGRDQPGGQPHENVCGRVHWEQFLQNTQQAR